MPEALKWDVSGSKLYETGTDRGVLFVMDSNGAYGKGVAWSGLTAVTQSPEGAEASDYYADNIKYVSLRSAETFGGTIEAYMYPEEWAACDGSAELAPGVYAGQQKRNTFGFSYRTVVGNDTNGDDYGYKIHLIYGATASPSERSYQTVNDSPEPITLSWEFETTPVNLEGYKPTALIEIDSTKVDSSNLKKLEDMIYGSSTGDSKLPTPDEVMNLFKTNGSSLSD